MGLRQATVDDEEIDPMTVRELTVLDQPEVAACCAPLSAEVLSAPGAEVLARQFAALADPVRLRLLSLLATAEDGAVCVCDLTEPVGRTQGTVSHHLRILVESGLATSEKRGRNVWYAVIPAALESLRNALAPR
ncbi:transcriptional regulator, ArsR family [Geodermatophilus telluris]|uniref:Transcriptional regulator, ArsR family n=1 Tax=Geodermatophilus telluris TaxID=1190417 RepID=A0A1G6U8Q6_9ACTN|nr:metalloregulator ArsR/SmtB family transcription factor [Geodermatophilus telluris]SDD37679.1 transcriptional regulator, ArsR family [Geodermatophilus telluris]